MNFTDSFLKLIKEKYKKENIELPYEEVVLILSKFFSSHNHSEISNFRLTDSIIKVEDILKYAIELGYSGVALTDHEALSGHIEISQLFLKLQKLKEKYNSIEYPEKSEDKEIKENIKLLEAMDNNFKLSLGNEIYLIDDIEDVTTNYVSGVTKFWHFLLLAKNKHGYKTLRSISSSAWDNHFKHGRMERVPTLKSTLEEIMINTNGKGNIIASTACLGGEFARLILDYCYDKSSTNKSKINKFVRWGIRIFGADNFFIELQPSPYESDKEDFDTSHEQIIFNKTAIMIAKAYGLNYTFATDTHYLKKEHRAIHASYLNSDEDNNGERELKDFYATTYMWGIEDLIINLLDYLTLPEVLDGFKGTMIMHSNIEIYDMYQPTIVPRDKHIPKFNVMHLMKDHYESIAPYIKKFAYSNDIQERYFLYKCELGLLSKKVKLTEEIIKRINIEMEEIWETSEKINMRVAPYYVLVEVLVNKIMWEISYVGIARGSVTGFYTAYLMEITQMNPLTYNLPHWRHLSKERPELPDVDLDSEASKRHLIFDKMKEYYGFDNVLNIMTIKTEGSKSTVATACRGWRGKDDERIDIDTSQMISDMIPFERGENWSLQDCFQGNEEKGRNRLTEFINAVDKYDGLKEIMLMIEGLVCGRSIHASGVYIFDNGYLEQNGRMRAPNGSYTTIWNMKDSDYVGGLKVDCLTIKALDKIHKTVDLLIEYGKIEDQGTIKTTYDKYIHPDVLEVYDPKMWEMIAENTLIDAFQFDTDVGANAGMKVKPTSIPEMAVANSLMRLKSDGGTEQPIDTYVRFKNDIALWYKEMEEWGLTVSEIHILEKHLLAIYGVADTQEVVMEMVMDSDISGFDVVQANKLRKAIAKKSEKILDEVKKLFYDKAEERGTSYELMSYVWEIQIKRQLGLTYRLK